MKAVMRFLKKVNPWDVYWIAVSILWGIAILPSVRKQPFPAVLIPKTKPNPEKKPGSVMEMNFRK